MDKSSSSNPDNPDNRTAPRSVELETERRLTSLETLTNYFATREEVQKIKNWIYGGTIGVIFVVVVGLLSIIKMLFDKMFDLLNK